MTGNGVRNPPESPNCTAGELPIQMRLPSTVLVTTSFASGSKTLTFLLKIRLPPTLLRSAPAQPPCQPWTIRLPRMLFF